MKKNKIWVNYLIKSTSLGLFLTFSITLNSQKNSIARVWNEVILECIRNDFARPTVHARNLFHLSAGIYDAWKENLKLIFLTIQFTDLIFPTKKQNIQEIRNQIRK